jgi:hypothetical protein
VLVCRRVAFVLKKIPAAVPISDHSIPWIFHPDSSTIQKRVLKKERREEWHNIARERN